MKRAPLPWLAVALAACRPSAPPAPLPSQVTVAFANPNNVPVPADVQLAVAFTYGDFVLATTLIAGLDATSSVVVPVATPPAGWENGVEPVETVTFPSLSTVEVYRPRLVLYEDTDQNGAPSLDDHVLAIDTSSSGSSVAAVLDLDTTLSNMTYEESQSYYTATGGLYTPFMRVSGTRGFLQLVDAATAGPLTLKLSDSPIPGEHLRCGRDPVYLSGDPLAPSADVAVRVDTLVSSDTFCGSTLPDCASVSLEGVTPPDTSPVNTEGHHRVAMCRAGHDFEALVVQTADMVCKSCNCTYITHADVWVAQSAAPPSWWPCGGTVARCDSTLPLYQIDETCVPATP